MFIATARHRLWTVTLWLSLLGFTWSLPVLSYLHIRHERADVQSGRYYTAKEIHGQDRHTTGTRIVAVH